MVKKLVIVAGIVVVVGLLLCGTSAVSYIRTSAGYVTESVRDSVPIEFEIQRARNEIENLLPEVRKNMYVIAKEEVEVQGLEEQITDAEAKLEKDKDDMLRLTSDLQTGEQVFRYAGRTYSAEQVKSDLANRLKCYKTNEATLASLQQILAARQQSLDAARQKLAAMQASKEELRVTVENLEARLQMIAATQASSEYEFDDSRLGRVKELVRNLQTRLEVTERLVNAEQQYSGAIPLDDLTPDNIADQVAEYFSIDEPLAETIAAN